MTKKIRRREVLEALAKVPCATVLLGVAGSGAMAETEGEGSRQVQRFESGLAASAYTEGMRLV